MERYSIIVQPAEHCTLGPFAFCINATVEEMIDEISRGRWNRVLDVLFERGVFEPTLEDIKEAIEDAYEACVHTFHGKEAMEQWIKEERRHVERLRVKGHIARRESALLGAAIEAFELM